jgi:hypothetical protein
MMMIFGVPRPVPKEDRVFRHPRLLHKSSLILPKRRRDLVLLPFLLTMMMMRVRARKTLMRSWTIFLLL